MPRLPSSLAPFATLLLVASACGAPVEDGYDIADDVIAAVGQPEIEDLQIVEEDCERTVTVDEYGFETETLICPDDGSGGAQTPGADVVDTPADSFDPDSPINADEVLAANGDLPTWLLDPLIEAVPDPDLRDGLLDLSQTIEAMDASCGSDFDSWRSSLDELAERSEALTERIRNGLGGDFIGTQSSRALGRSIFERAVLETGCAAPGSGEPKGGDQLIDAGVLDATARAGRAVADLDQTIGNQIMGRLFHFYSTEPNYQWLRSQDRPVDTIVFGTSQAGAAVQVPQLSERLGVNAGNAFLPGSLAEVQQHWFGEVESYINPKTVVWLTGAIDLLIDCDVDNGRQEQFTERLENRQRAFQANGWFRTLDPISVVLGPAGPPNPGRGNGDKAGASDAGATEAHAAEYADRFAAAQFCTPRAEVIASAVAELTANGRHVIIVGMPLNPAVATSLPDPAGQTAQALAQLERDHVSTIDNVDIIDLSGTMQDPAAWTDYTHLTASGADEFTDLLADALSGVAS